MGSRNQMYRAYEMYTDGMYTDGILPMKEWVNIVKQEKAMHIIYWKVKCIENIYHKLKKNHPSFVPHTTPEMTIYHMLPKKSTLLSILSEWKVEYENKINNIT